MKTQGQDGTPFLSYYDHAHALSFVWDSTADGEDFWIDVSHGGYGEPVIARIPWVIRFTGERGNVSTDLLAAFKRTCEEFINTVHAIEATDPQAHEEASS